MMTSVWALGISLAIYIAHLLDTKQSLSPDGRFYLQLDRPRPYCWRWLWPWLCGKSPKRWQWVSGISLVSLGPLMAFYLDTLGFAPWQQLAGAALLCGLPGIMRVNAQWPILVDAPAMALALASAGLTLAGHPLLGAGVALLAGASRETAPLFAAIFALSPWPLIGLLAVRWGRKPAEIPDWAEAWLRRPMMAALAARQGKWFDWRVMLLPWGAVSLLAVLADWSASSLAVAAGLALVAGYAQLLTAQDSARLFSWAAPAVIAFALTGLAPEWAGGVCVLHLLNPYRGI